jgi:hypothetical protein
LVLDWRWGGGGSGERDGRTTISCCGKQAQRFEGQKFPVAVN